MSVVATDGCYSSLLIACVRIQIAAVQCLPVCVPLWHTHNKYGFGFKIHAKTSVFKILVWFSFVRNITIKWIKKPANKLDIWCINQFAKKKTLQQFHFSLSVSYVCVFFLVPVSTISHLISPDRFHVCFFPYSIRLQRAYTMQRFISVPLVGSIWVRLLPLAMERRPF